MKGTTCGIRHIGHIISLILCVTAITAMAKHSNAPAASSDTITSARDALTFLRAKNYPPGYETRLVSALRTLSRDRTYRDSLPLYCSWALDYFAWGTINSGWLDIAKQLFDKALIYCPANDSTTYYSIQSGLAYVNLQKGNKEQAFKTLEKVMAYHQRIKDLDSFVKDLCSMGAYHYTTDRKAESLKMYKEALEICRASGNRMMECVILIRTGNRFGTFEQRDSMLNKALTMEFDMNLSSLYSHTYLELGRLYQDHELPAKALIVVRKAHDEAVSNNQTDIRIQSLVLLADIYGSIGEWQLSSSISKEATYRISQQRAMMDAEISNASLKAQTLIRWCEDNVMVTPNGFVITEEREHRLAIYAWLIATAVVIASLIFLYSAVIRRRTAARMADMATEEKVSELKQANDALTARTEEQEERIAEMARTIHYLNLFHSNFNLYVGKLRSMVMKAMGKDEAANATVRTIGAFISGNRLPPYSTEFDAEVRKEEEAFLERLQKQYPELSDNERQLCVYLRMGLSTQEICVLTGNQPRSINMARYRLRKTLDLAESDNLEAVIARI